MIKDESGFTLVELISVIAASALFVALILDFGINYWRYSSLLESDLDTFVSRLDTQDVVRDSIGTTTGLINQNSIPDTHANNPDPTAGANYWVTEHAVPGNFSAASNTTTPLVYYRRVSVTSSNSLAMNGTQPYEDEFVMYIDGSKKQLLLRTLANPNVTNNKVRTSCPPASATSTCPADKVLMDSLASIDVTYYSRSGNTLNWQSVYNTSTNTYIGPDFPLVEAVQYTFHIQKKTLFQKSTSTINDTVVRIALRNT
ncbi:MAG TPA: hypothetical protein VLF87_03765 [Patescibacteria group bacterium]|nr:hypothetical protein [Candidatus Saccharimonadales bacterium]HSX47075.1 hypothetical protein [Patescibacteria group bacterium]